MIKKNIILMLLMSLITYTFAWDDFWTDFFHYINSTAPKLNVYETLTNYYENKFDYIERKSIEETAKQIWTDSKTIENILNWNLTKCINIMSQLKLKNPKCKETNSKNTTFECLVSCYNNVLDIFKVNHKKIASYQIIKDTLIWENNLIDALKNNSPYDLISDIDIIAHILFKKWIKKDLLENWWKVNMIIENSDSIPPSEAPIYTDPNSWTNNWKWNWNSNNWNSNNWNNNNWNANNWNWLTYPNNNNKNNDTTQEKINKILNKTWDKNQIKKPKKIKPIFTNYNFQIWNICKTWNILKQKDKDKDLIVKDDFLKTKDKDSLFYNIFDDWEKKWAIIWWSKWIANLFSPNHDNNTLIEKKLAWWNVVCAVNKKKLLTTCFKLIPSWPKWPVWWTVKVKSSQKIIRRISDVLRDIKQSFIIPSEHWDESLWIDYKHIEFSKIMSFVIVLTKKPVFKYRKNDKSEIDKTKKWNENDTQNCPSTSRFLANLYTNLKIANCHSEKPDIDKYLFTNRDNDQFSPWEVSNSSIWTDNSDNADWQKNVEKQIKQFVVLTKKMFTDMDDLFDDFRYSSETLKAKSELK